MLRLMGQEYGKPCTAKNFAVIVSIDGTRPPEEVFPSPMAVKPMRNRLEGKVFGEQDYTVWDQRANRLLPYRMYIPSTYSARRPQKTVVCFHGGDANPDYMFKHTHNEIEEYAEDRGYILLALCSYRKFTFFGGSRLPTGSDRTLEGDENPCGLTQEELEWCAIAEQSVKLQLDDAVGRYNLDQDAMVALGNSGGSLGIFRQIAQAGGPLFQGAVCSGGMPNIRAVEPQRLRESKARFLLLVSSEDAFDAQYTLRTGRPYLREQNVDVQCQVIGGGSHLLGWTHGLKKVFDFFDEVLEGGSKG